MKVKWHFIKNLRLDPAYGLLNARSTLLCWEIFTYLDWKQTSSLDDIQFSTFLTFVTDLKLVQAERVFDIFDLDRSGSVEFDELEQGKQFMYQHWRTTFEILDEDGSKEVSRTEFETLGFLFNFTPQAVRKIYQEFDVTGNSELDYKEFRLFVLAAIDMQTKLENKAKERANRPDFVHKLKMVLSDLTGVEF